MNRNYTIDTLRTIAALLVVLLHVAASYVTSGISNNSFDFSFWAGNVVDSFTRICVPIFVLISGMFLLGRKDTFIGFYKKRASKVLLPLIFWSVIYLIYRAIVNYGMNSNFDAVNLIKTAALGKPFYHMWYLFMLLGLYLITPLLNRIISTSSRKAVWRIALSLLLIGMVYDFFLGKKFLFIFWFISYIGYYMLGYLLKNSSTKISSTILFIIYLISGLLISILSYYTAKDFNSLYFYSYLSPFVVISSISIYILFQQIRYRENILSRISHLTFGIYLIHAGVLHALFIGKRKLDIQILENPIIAIPLEFAITFLISLLIATVLYKSKILKKTI